MSAKPGNGAGSERKLFGTDGVRGVANVHPITAEVALQLGRALAWKVRSGSHRHRIVIGKDTRLSGYMLETAIAAGICSMGVDVLLCGPLPTPGIAFITQSMRADAGVVISASHNPYQDNGIKIFDRTASSSPTRRTRDRAAGAGWGGHCRRLPRPASHRRARSARPSASTTPSAATWSS